MMKKFYVLLLCVTVGMVSCEKGDSQGNVDGENPVVYTVGSVETNEKVYAAIWKNGVEIALMDKAVPDVFELR